MGEGCWEKGDRSFAGDAGFVCSVYEVCCACNVDNVIGATKLDSAL